MSISECFFMDTSIGFIIFSKSENVLLYEFFSGEVKDIADKLIKLEEGELVDELKSICSKIPSLNVSKIVFESERLIPLVKRFLRNIELYVDPFNPIFKKFRGLIPQTAVSLGFIPSINDYYDLLHDISMFISRRRIKKAVEKRDLLLAQSINTIDDLNKIINMMATRLREWYGIHFPELNSIIDDHKLYSKIVSEIGSRDDFDFNKIVVLGGSKEITTKVMNIVKSSIGADFSDYDIDSIKLFAKMLNSLYEVRDKLEEYVDSVTDDVCPNLKALVGPLISARLISLAGGLDKLAKLPSSTIQVLGAEKALFRALRTGAKPPKHGIIFQCQEVHGSPRWQRGKIARALAGKLSIAAKIDAFSGTYIGDKLKQDLHRRIEEIKRLYPKPVKKRIETKEKKVRRRGRG